MKSQAEDPDQLQAQETLQDEERYMIGGVLTLAERSVRADHDTTA